MPGKVHERARVVICLPSLHRSGVPGRIHLLRQIVCVSICVMSVTLPAWSQETTPAPESETAPAEAAPAAADPAAPQPAGEPPTTQDTDPSGVGDTAPNAEEPPVSPSPDAVPAEVPPADSPDESPDQLTSPPVDAYQWIGPQLFPLYEHYRRTADNTTVRNLLYIYRSTYRPPPDESRSVLLAPLFYFRKDERSRSRRLYLFPLLHFSASGGHPPPSCSIRSPRRFIGCLLPMGSPWY